MKVLVVTDEKKFSRAILMSLQGEGFAIDVAYDKAEAIMKAVQGYNLILLDTDDNITVIRELREKQISSSILCLSAKNTVAEIVAGLNAGCDDYLTKPFAFIELVARIRALIRRGTGSRGVKLVYADMRLDPVSHKVWRNGTEIHLSTKEYGVLECFMRHPEQLLSREMIVENAWAEQINYFSNLIDVYISYLRKKIDQGSGIKLIHTIRGAGYIFKKV